MSVLIVDGYNVAHAWKETAAILRSGRLEEARRRLVGRLAEYAAVSGVHVEVVFDGPSTRVVDALPDIVDGVVVRFSGRSGSADAVIERLVYAARRGPGTTPVRVATSDRLQRAMVRAMGAETVDAPSLEAEVRQAALDVERTVRRLREAAPATRRVEGRLPPDVYRHLEALRRGRPRPPAGDEPGLPPG